MGNNTIQPGGFLLLVPTAAGPDAKEPKPAGKLEKAEVAALRERVSASIEDGAVDRNEAAAIEHALCPAISAVEGRDGFEEVVGIAAQALDARGPGEHMLEQALRVQRAIFEVRERLGPVPEAPRVQIRALVEHLQSALSNDGMIYGGERDKALALVARAYDALSTPEEAESLRDALRQVVNSGKVEYPHAFGADIESLAKIVPAKQALSPVLRSEVPPSQEVRDLVTFLQSCFAAAGRIDDAEQREATRLAARAFNSLRSADEAASLRGALDKFLAVAPAHYPAMLRAEVQKTYGLFDAHRALDEIAAGGQGTTEAGAALVALFRSALNEHGLISSGKHDAAARLMARVFAACGSADEASALRGVLQRFAKSAPCEYPALFASLVSEASGSFEANRALDGLGAGFGSNAAVQQLVAFLRTETITRGNSLEGSARAQVEGLMKSAFESGLTPEERSALRDGLLGFAQHARIEYPSLFRDRIVTFARAAQ